MRIRPPWPVCRPVMASSSRRRRSRSQPSAAAQRRAGRPVGLQKVVAGEHVHERYEGHDRRDPPGQLCDQPEVAPKHQVDPDQHHRYRMQDAQQIAGTTPGMRPTTTAPKSSTAGTISISGGARRARSAARPAREAGATAHPPPSVDGARGRCRTPARLAPDRRDGRAAT